MRLTLSRQTVKNQHLASDSGEVRRIKCWRKLFSHMRKLADQVKQMTHRAIEIPALLATLGIWSSLNPASFACVPQRETRLQVLKPSTTKSLASLTLTNSSMAVDPKHLAQDNSGATKVFRLFLQTTCVTSQMYCDCHSSCAEPKHL